MNGKKKVLAICGSTRKDSGNLQLIHAVARIAEESFDVEIFDSLADIPHFNPDIQQEPETVTSFKQKIRHADGVLICTPEYAMGVPGTLKNAIDWTVSSSDFSHKPVALITASSSGHKAHRSLQETLQVIEAEMTEETKLLVSFVKTKVNASGITDEATLQLVKDLVDSLVQLMNK